VLPHLPGFDPRPTAYGYLLVPAASRAGFIRYERRVRPLVRISALVDARLAGMTVTERGPIAARFTAEGEYAARVTLRGTHGQWMQRDFGVVLGDDFASVIDATCVVRAEAELFDSAVDRLITQLVLGAPLRRRRYRYTAPADRRPRVRDLETDWIGDGTLTVFPAERAGIELALAVAQRDGLTIDRVDRTDDDVTIVLASAERRWRAVAARISNGWLYAMELVAPAARPLDALRACLASADRLPAPPTIITAPIFDAYGAE
jgi:hypothetical protein